jgi:hypothetical protein
MHRAKRLLTFFRETGQISEAGRSDYSGWSQCIEYPRLLLKPGDGSLRV